MLKLVESEFLKNYYMVHRLVLMWTRTRGIPKSEPTAIHTSSNHVNRRFLKNDVEAYQEASEVSNFIYHS